MRARRKNKSRDEEEDEEEAEIAADEDLSDEAILYTGKRNRKYPDEIPHGKEIAKLKRHGTENKN